MIMPSAENQNIITLKWTSLMRLARTASILSLKATKTMTTIPISLAYSKSIMEFSSSKLPSSGFERAMKRTPMKHAMMPTHSILKKASLLIKYPSKAVQKACVFCRIVKRESGRSEMENTFRHYPITRNSERYVRANLCLAGTAPNMDCFKK